MKLICRYLTKQRVLQYKRTLIGDILLRSIATCLPPHADEASLYVHVSVNIRLTGKLAYVSACLILHVCISSFLQWPYCLKRCSYCNFNKYIPRSQNHTVMTECLQKETRTLLQLSQISRSVSV